MRHLLSFSRQVRCRVVIAVVAGVVITATIAVVRACFPVPENYPIPSGSRDGWMAPAPRNWPSTPTMHLRTTGFGIQMSTATAVSDTPFRLMRQREVRVGWPLYAFKWSVNEYSDGIGYHLADESRILHGIRLKANSEDEASQWARIPLVPIYGGVIVDVGIWSAVTYACWTCMMWLRCRMRRQRKRCERCGHLVMPNQLQCTECGTATPVRDVPRHGSAIRGLSCPSSVNRGDG